MFLTDRYPACMPDCNRSPEITQELPGASIDPASLSVSELRQAMADGRITATALTRHYLDRIEELNPALHAVITVSPDALAEAAASDRALASGEPRGPLEGIPVLVKDNVQVAGLPTTAGSSALLPALAPDAFIVSRLRAAGAVILAKANLSEWANFRSTHSSSGWSTVGGQTANPYALDRSPSGSSSGSAAGVAAGLAPLAVGTETDGSIVSPSSACGVVGIKPTAGLVSRTGIVPLSPVQDTAGPMARSVADAAAMLSVLVAADPLDPAAGAPDHCSQRTGVAVDYTGFLDPAALEGARIGVWRAVSADADAATAALLDAAAERLHTLGAKLADPVDLPDVDKITQPEFGALEYEFKYGINAYLKHLAGLDGAPGVPGSLAALIEFNERNAGTVLSRFGQEIFHAAEATSGDLADPDYLEMRGAASGLALTALETPMAEHRLDAIVSLTTNPAWLTDYVLGDHHVFGASRPAAVVGWPAISVPFGYVSGLPVGVTFVGPRWTEPRLIALAYAFEQATAARRPPALLPTLAAARGPRVSASPSPGPAPRRRQHHRHASTSTSTRQTPNQQPHNRATASPSTSTRATPRTSTPAPAPAPRQPPRPRPRQMNVPYSCL
jgi:amidase